VKNMPAFDGTGPQGQGPMTGRGLGRCGKGSGMRVGRHCGYGRGLGRYFGWNAPQTKEDKINDAKVYKKALEEEMEGVEKELADLQK
jgi:hypothetical protein